MCITCIISLIWEAREHKWMIDYFITNMKTSKVIPDIRVYRNNEIDSEHYFLCAKVNFPDHDG